MSSQNSFARCSLALGLLLGVVPAIAHHGTGASYDQKKWVTIKGTVKEFLWRNPHSGLFLEVKDEAGAVTAYSIEMYSPGLMVKQGYTRKTFQAGDQVEIDVHPSLAGQPTGECLGCRVLVNGKDPAVKP
jgi:hypothetical protein